MKVKISTSHEIKFHAENTDGSGYKAEAFIRPHISFDVDVPMLKQGIKDWLRDKLGAEVTETETTERTTSETKPQ